MVGSDVVVAFPTQGTVLEYDLNAKVTSYQAVIHLPVYTIERSAHILDVSNCPPTVPCYYGLHIRYNPAIFGVSFEYH